MKTVTIVRHAKSSWDNTDWSDLERPLNKRGLVDAPFMANVISNLKDMPDVFYSSPAVRAYTTALEYAKSFNFEKENIIVDRGIYERGKKHIINLIKLTDNKLSDIIIFGHNPDITSLASYFSGEFFDNMPTCGTLCVDFDIDTWQQIEEKNGTIRFFEYPKKYPKKDRIEFSNIE